MSFRQHLIRAREDLSETQAALDATQAALAESQKALAETQKALEESKIDLSALQKDVSDLNSSLKREVNKQEYDKKSKIWLHMRDMVYLIILTYNGLIFGGAATVIAMHDFWVKKYTDELVKKQGCDFTFYNDPEFHPESFEGRTMLPNDIDVYIRGSDYKTLIEFLKSRYNIEFLEIKKQYFCNPKFMEHVKLVIVPLQSQIIKNFRQSYRLEFDFIILKKEYEQNISIYQKCIPPYNNGLDFRCNALCIRQGKYGTVELGSIAIGYETFQKYRFKSLINQLSERKNYEEIETESVMQIIKDNESKTAVLINPPISIRSNIVLRAEKMVNKGYKLDLSILYQKMNEEKNTNVEEGEVCCLCRDELTSRLIMPCMCQVKLHPQCFRDYISDSIAQHRLECLMCKRTIGDRTIRLWHSIFIPLLQLVPSESL